MKSLRGKKVLLTLGATREYLDPVRFFSNASSGKLGLALARAFKAFGAHPFLICGPQISLPPSLPGVSVVSARQMYAETKKRFKKFDIFVSSAAVSDWRPRRVVHKKIHKEKGTILLPLVRNPDILQLLARKKKKQFCIGFALEDVQGEQNAQKKMIEKNCDLIVLNSPSTLGSDFIRATVFAPERPPIRLKQMKKNQFAKKLCQMLEQLY